MMAGDGMWTKCLTWAVLGVLLWAGPAAADARQTPARTARRTPVVNVFERTRDAVVNIAATLEVQNYEKIFPDSLFDGFFGPRRLRPRTERYTSLGSGFVIHPDGYVVTNAHVVMRAVSQKVIFADNTEYQAKRVALDETHDLGILKIDSGKPLPAVQLGRSDDLMIGETVIAIGNPLGYQHTVTSGIISATDRTLTFSDDIEYTGLIQTDASINRGNSGGPLLNVLGELIGINTAIRGDAQNICFAIPVDTLRKLLPEMLTVELEHRRRLKVGLRLSRLDPVYVVEATGPAADAGIEPGDLVVSVDGKPLKQDVDFYIYLLKIEPTHRLVLEVKRNGRLIKADLHPQPIPIPDAAKLLHEKFGLSVEPLTEPQAKEIHPQLQGGLVITGVQRGSPADQAGFRRGHLIIQIDKYSPSDLDEVGLLLEQVQQGKRVLFRALEVRRREIWVLQGYLIAR